MRRLWSATTLHSEAGTPPAPRRPGQIAWAKRLKQVFEIDALRRQRYSGRTGVCNVLAPPQKHLAGTHATTVQAGTLTRRKPAARNRREVAGAVAGALRIAVNRADSDARSLTQSRAGRIHRSWWYARRQARHSSVSGDAPGVAYRGKRVEAYRSRAAPCIGLTERTHSIRPRMLWSS